MGLEIERKFLVLDDSWRAGARSVDCIQGYLVSRGPLSVRVRVMGDQAFLTIKKSLGILSNHEFEYPVPVGDARDMLAKLCEGYPVEKTRHYVEHGGMTWEVDEFHGMNAGLIVAELELESEDQAFAHPAWLGDEVSADGRYKNSSLSRAPYATWGK